MTMMAPQSEILIDENLHTHLWPKVGQWQSDGQAKVILQSDERIAPKTYAAYTGSFCSVAALCLADDEFHFTK
jgi:urea transport system substrate-binding protein